MSQEQQKQLTTISSTLLKVVLSLCGVFCSIIFYDMKESVKDLRGEFSNLKEVDFKEFSKTIISMDARLLRIEIKAELKDKQK